MTKKKRQSVKKSAEALLEPQPKFEKVETKEKKEVTPEPVIPPATFDADEGTYYEQTFSPCKFSIWNDNKNPLGRPHRVAVLEDANGERVRIEGNTVIRRVLQSLNLKDDVFGESLWQSDEDSITKYATERLEQQQQSKQKPTVKFLLNDKQEVVGASTTIHKQILWSKIRGIIETAIAQSYGETEVIEPDEGVNHYNYKIPVKSEYVSAWLSVDKGNNKAIYTRPASIGMHARFRTDKGVGDAPACQNWASLWGPVSAVFDIKLKRIGYESLVVLQQLSARYIHMKGTFADETQAIAKLVTSMKAIQEGVEQANALIEASTESPLAFDEMTALLKAYDEKVTVPLYVRELIMAKATKEGDETVWGFSQAISYVRTHEEMRQRKNSKTPREAQALVLKLENIAGEVYSLTPTIEAIHKQLGPLTFELLIEKPRKKQQAQQDAVIPAPRTT